MRIGEIGASRTFSKLVEASIDPQSRLDLGEISEVGSVSEVSPAFFGSLIFLINLRKFEVLYTF